MRYQSVTQYSISIPGPVTYLSVTVTSYMLPILTTPVSGYRNNHEREHHVRFNCHNFVAVDWIAFPRSRGTQVARREFYGSEQETITDGNYSRTSGVLKLSSTFEVALPCQALFYVLSPNQDPPAIINGHYVTIRIVMLRYCDTISGELSLSCPYRANKIDLIKVYVI